MHLAPPPEGWTAEARKIVTSRLDRLLAVWLDDPLAGAGFRRTAYRWVLGRGPVRPTVEVQRRKKIQFDGVIDFTINWGVWVEPFAQQVGSAKKPSPSASTAPFAARIGDLLGDQEDVWWAVAAKGVIRITTTPRLEREPPSADDDVARAVREELIPMLMPVTTVRAAISAIEEWRHRGFTPSTIYTTLDPLVMLRRFVEPDQNEPAE
ncbi:MAG TPA: DUF4304 domain-containing protein [Acidimicrobiales bacterium]|nr:DUF4304 domain-containing protein [Acidimicrobiales bacterium]